MEEKRARATAWMILVLILISPLQAQDDKSEPVGRLNSNVAFLVNVPVSQTATYTPVGWGFVYGAGYNFTKNHSLVGEIMWNSLRPSDAALAPLRTALQNSSIQGHGNLVTLMGNYRLRFESKIYGAYLIGGGGMYYRNVGFSQPVSIGASLSCSQAWLWWGFTCTSGMVTANQTLASSSSTVLGGNIGVGFTVRIPDSHYSFYLESRYYYAPTKGAHTQLIPVTIGMRF